VSPPRGRGPREDRIAGYPAYGRYPAIQAEKNSVREYWRIIRKHKWMVLATLVVLVAIVTIGTLMSRPVYRAEAKIEIGKETERVLAGQRIMEVETANVFNPFYLQTQVDILRSRDIARRVIQRLNLEVPRRFQGEGVRTACRRMRRMSGSSTPFRGGTMSRSGGRAVWSRYPLTPTVQSWRLRSPIRWRRSTSPGRWRAGCRGLGRRANF
jgi:hypothetical protein